MKLKIEKEAGKKRNKSFKDHKKEPTKNDPNQEVATKELTDGHKNNINKLNKSHQYQIKVHKGATKELVDGHEEKIKKLNKSHEDKIKVRTIICIITSS